MKKIFKKYRILAIYLDLSCIIYAICIDLLVHTYLLLVDVSKCLRIFLQGKLMKESFKLNFECLVVMNIFYVLVKQKKNTGQEKKENISIN